MASQHHHEQQHDTLSSSTVQQHHHQHQLHPSSQCQHQHVHQPLQKASSLQLQHHQQRHQQLHIPTSRRASTASGIQSFAPNLQQCALIVDDLPASAVSAETQAERQWRWSRHCLRCFTCVVLGFVLAVAGGICVYRAAMVSWWTDQGELETVAADSPPVSRYRLAGAWLLALGCAVIVFGCLWAAKFWCQANQAGCYGSEGGGEREGDGGGGLADNQADRESA